MLPRGKPYGSILFPLMRDNYMKIKEILAKIRQLAPERNQSGWDNSGVQIAGVEAETFRVAVCLEPTPQMVEQCLEWGAGMVVTHHPLYMKPKGLSRAGMFLDVVRQVLSSGAWLYAAHTSLDTRPGGPAFWLGGALGLKNAEVLEVEHGRAPVEASFYGKDPVSRETADIWANHEGIHSVSQTASGEVRVVCDEEAWGEVAAAIEFSLGRRPTFYLRSLTAPRSEIGFGEVGVLPRRMGWKNFVKKLGEVTGRETFSVSGSEPEAVKTVAYCGGSGASLVARAAGAGADVFITGDMKYHAAVEAETCVIDVGHFSLEEEMMRLFAGELDRALDGVEVKFFKGTDPFRLCAAS